jgi:hypothetical protein
MEFGQPLLFFLFSCFLFSLFAKPAEMELLADHLSLSLPSLQILALSPCPFALGHKEGGRPEVRSRVDPLLPFLLSLHRL